MDIYILPNPNEIQRALSRYIEDTANHVQVTFTESSNPTAGADDHEERVYEINIKLTAPLNIATVTDANNLRPGVVLRVWYAEFNSKMQRVLKVWYLCTIYKIVQISKFAQVVFPGMLENDVISIVPEKRGILWDICPDEFNPANNTVRGMYSNPVTTRGEFNENLVPFLTENDILEKTLEIQKVVRQHMKEALKTEKRRKDKNANDKRREDDGDVDSGDKRAIDVNGLVLERVILQAVPNFSHQYQIVLVSTS